jgi:PAS domain S-box-containing protein
MAGARKHDENRPRDELLAELTELRAGSRELELKQLVHGLEVHQEELRSQQAQLLDTQRALEEARDRYARLFDFAPIAHVVLDAHGVIYEANLGAARLLEIERSRLLSKTLTRYVVPADRDAMLAHLSRCRSGLPTVHTELEVRRSSGGTVAVQLTSAPAPSAGIAMFHTAIIDLSERKRSDAERARSLEEQRRLLQDEQVARAASQAKDRFIAMLSHELRTPLAPILFALESARARGPIPDTLRPMLDMIRRNVVLETRLIDDLLDMTRIVQGKLSVVPEIVDVHDVINDVVVLCQDQLQASPATLKVVTAAAAHHVRADPVRLRQVIWNLLNNALRNTGRGGHITIGSANRQRDWVTLTVSDTGRGIDSSMLGRIFTFFEQDEAARRAGVGLGLGLPISKAIVESHGGSIRAVSEGAGKGATFTVELRTVESENTRAPASDDAPATKPQTSILLVEDDADSAEAIGEFLRMHGFATKLAASVREALELYEPTDILISDIALPDGSGHELMLRLSSQAKVVGIALSGYGTPDDIHRSREAGFARHITKPVEPAALLAAIAELRDDSRATAAAQSVLLVSD